MIKAALVAGLLASSTNARAEDPATEAKQHVDRASELHKAGKLDDALIELKTAYALDPRPQLLFAMGQIHVQLGQCPQAIVYYERFLATKPRSDLADVTKQAIEACKTNPPPVEGPPPEPTPTPTPSPTPPPATPTMQVTKSPSVRPWYTDVLGDALVAGGVASGVIALIAWRGAVSDRDDAVNADGYEQFDSLIDSSHTKQKVAIGFGIGAGALITAGVLRLVLHDRTEAGSDISIAPASGGAALHWTRQF